MYQNESKAYKVFMVFNYMFMMLIVVLMLFPFLHILAKAFNEGYDASRGGIVIWPRKFTVQNFLVLFSDKTVISALGISVARVVIGTILALIVQFGAGYALSRERFPGKSLFLAFFMIPMYIQAGMVPTYVLYSKIGLLNNFLVYILPITFSIYNVIIIRTFIQSTIPKSLEESAFIDGANEIKIFFSIILPLSKPILATIGLWVMVAHWNDWTTTLYYVRNSSLHTLQYKMMEMIKESERIQKMVAAAVESGQSVENVKSSTSASLMSAQVIVTTLPIMCVYPFLQKYFTKGIMVGSVKG